MIRSFLSHAFTAWLQAKELYCNSLPPIGEANHAWRQAAARSAAVRALLGSLKELPEVSFFVYNRGSIFR